MMATSTTRDTSAELAELYEFIDSLSLSDEDRNKASIIMTCLDSKLKSQKLVSNVIANLLSMIRRDLKYLIFDLQATRRERDELKRRLKKSDPRDFI